MSQEIGIDKIAKYSGVLILIVFAFVGGLITGRTSEIGDFTSIFSGKESKQPTTLVNFSGDTDKEPDVKDINFDLYWEVWDTMSDRYVDPSKVDQEKMFYDSIKGMVNSYGDPATIFLDPEETEAFNKSTAGNAFSGIGAELGYDEGRIIVISPIEGSPAVAAGIRAGDVILKVDDVEILQDENIYDVVTKIRGEKGTTVKLTVLHRGDSELSEISIVRGDITVPSITFKYDDSKKIATIDIARFTDASLREWQDNWDSAVNQVKESGAEGLIIDLRGNPGGFFDAAVYAASDFLDKGKIVSLQEDRKGKRNEFKVERKGELLNIPVVVLVNEGSASASEILAGALQINNRAQVIGVNTYGKGTAQSVLDNFEDGSSLHITVFKWLLPNGEWLNKENPIVPNKVIEISDEAFKAGEDPQLNEAYKTLGK